MYETIPFMYIYFLICFNRFLQNIYLSKIFFWALLFNIRFYHILYVANVQLIIKYSRWVLPYNTLGFNLDYCKLYVSYSVHESNKRITTIKWISWCYIFFRYERYFFKCSAIPITVKLLQWCSKYLRYHVTFYQG